MPRWVVLGQRYVCPSACAYEWVATAEGWEGPYGRNALGPEGHGRTTSHEHFKDQQSDCWAAIRRAHRPAGLLSADNNGDPEVPEMPPREPGPDGMLWLGHLSGWQIDVREQPGVWHRCGYGLQLRGGSEYAANLMEAIAANVHDCREAMKQPFRTGEQR